MTREGDLIQERLLREVNNSHLIQAISVKHHFKDSVRPGTELYFSSALLRDMHRVTNPK